MAGLEGIQNAMTTATTNNNLSSMAHQQSETQTTFAENPDSNLKNEIDGLRLRTGEKKEAHLFINERPYVRQFTKDMNIYHFQGRTDQDYYKYAEAYTDRQTDRELERGGMKVCT